MGRAKQDFQWVKAAGRQFNFVQNVGHAVRELGGTDADLDRASEDPAKLLQIAQVIMADKIASTQKAPAAPQPLQATIVAEFTASVNRDDPLWKNPIEKKRYYYVNPSLTVDRFSLQGSGVTTEKFVDLDFSGWPQNPTTQEILAEAQRLGCTRLDRSASESSLNIRPTDPNGRSVVCICIDEWTERGCGVVGYVIERASGRHLDVRRLSNFWYRAYCVFRFRAPRK